MTTMTAVEAQAELKRRLRRYFVIVLGLLGSVFLLPVFASLALKSSGVAVTTFGPIVGIVTAVGMFSIVGFSWYLVFKLWRCPACDTNIYWVVSMNMSAFASMYGKRHCPKCGIELFAPGRSRRFLIVVFLVIGVFIALGAIAGASARVQREKQQQTTPVQRP